MKYIKLLMLVIIAVSILATYGCEGCSQTNPVSPDQSQSK